MVTDRIMKTNIRLMCFGVLIRITNGKIFCQVIMTNGLIQERHSMISGNQKCNAAAPILSRRNKLMKVEGKKRTNDH